MKGSKYPGGTSGKEPAGDVRDTGLIPGLGTSPRGRHGNPLQVFFAWRMADYSPWGCKESDTTEAT